MKPNSFTYFVTTLLSYAFLATAGCAESQKDAEVSSTPTPTTTVQIKARPVETGTIIPPEVSAVALDIAASSWPDIKDDVYDQRAHFSAGLKQLEAKVDGQIAELLTKRAAMKSTIRTDEWDFSMKEMNNSRVYLMSVAEELIQATPATWAQKKEKIEKAWVRTQDAYGKVKVSTTG